MTKINVDDINNYKYKEPDKCYIKDCQNTAVWWIDDNTFGLCWYCYKQLEKGELK